MGERLWLVGMMGAGKTTVGSDVASQTETAFWDTDRLIEDRAGMSVRELFETIGVVAFRDLERQAVEAAATLPGVIATGGGVVLDADSRQTMRDSGVVIYLRANPSTLARRVDGSTTRPLLDDADPGEALAELLRVRDPHYRASAHHVVATNGKRRHRVVEEVIRLWTGT
ncbi:MAG TPA: shikimate kinase [Acidimicrobiia bacterium]|jgi:shikimate kinase